MPDLSRLLLVALFELVTDSSEDCLPPTGDIQAVGPSLPEFEILGYPETKQAYYIRCQDCVERFKNPKDEDERIWGIEWNRDLKVAEARWDGKDVDEPTVSESKRDLVDLTTPSPAKMEASSSMYTMTTEAESLSSEDVSAVVQELRFGRDVIVLD
jgi:hypothetical protein